MSPEHTRVFGRRDLPRLARMILDTQPDVDRAARRLTGLYRRAAVLPPDCPVAELEAVADAMAWEHIRLIRALQGKETP